MGDDGGGSLLVVLLETHAAAWPALASPSARGGAGVSPASFVAQVGAFIGAYELEAEDNAVVVLGVHEGCCPLLYRSPSMWGDGDDAPAPASAATVADRLAAGVAALAAAPAPAGPPALAAALARALCIAARACPQDEEGDGGAPPLPGSAPARAAARPRVLILATAASDAASDAYVPVMNVAFAAQKLGVPVDVCALGGGRGSGGGGPLAAAAHLTRGLVHAPASRDAVMVHLTSVFAPSASTRTLLAAPRAAGVDLRASCFCHASPVDVGHVCSVCLSIFCGPRETCATCGADFGAGSGGVGGKRGAAGDAAAA